MPVNITSSPSGVLPGTVLGKPIRIPHVMLCTQGERWCGRHWTANNRRQLAEYMAERRRHEESCRGGLILASR